MIKIHRILSFNQSNWLKFFTDFKTEKRKESSDEFNKYWYRLMNNPIYGKSCESDREKMNVKLINDKKKYLKYASKPGFFSQKIFDKTFCAVHYKKNCINIKQTHLYRLLYSRSIQLEMYQFHCDYILKKFNNVKLLMTDTDSLVYELKM